MYIPTHRTDIVLFGAIGSLAQNYLRGQRHSAGGKKRGFCRLRFSVDAYGAHR
jgi:hypothetical protein